MPSSREHVKTAKKDLGYVHEWLHHFMDYPSSFYGSQHRKFFHDVRFVLMIKRLVGHNLAKEALHHIVLDRQDKHDHISGPLLKLEAMQTKLTKDKRL